MPNQPTPVVLSDEALQEVEARPSFWPAHDAWRETPEHKKHVILEAGERDALCQTVRALRGQYESAVSDFAIEINALREQLAEARKRIEKQDTIISAYENQDEEALTEAESL